MQAHNALLLGVTTTAIAAAANLLLSAHTHAMFSVAGDHSALPICLDLLGITCFKSGSVTMHAHPALWHMSALEDWRA